MTCCAAIRPARQPRRQRRFRRAQALQRASGNSGSVGSGSGWSRYLSGYETGLWLGGMWFFGGLITMGLLSFNLAGVQAGDPTLPYVLARTGCPGLLLVTFMVSMEARSDVPLAGAPVAAYAGS